MGKERNAPRWRPLPAPAPWGPTEGHLPFSVLPLQTVLSNEAERHLQRVVTVTLTEHLPGARMGTDRCSPKPSSTPGRVCRTLLFRLGAQGTESLLPAGVGATGAGEEARAAGICKQVAFHTGVGRGSAEQRPGGAEGGHGDKQGQHEPAWSVQECGAGRGRQCRARGPLEDSLGAVMGGEFEPEDRGWGFCLPDSLWPQH